MHALVHGADIQASRGATVRDRDGGVLLMATLFGACPFLLKLYADGGYAGPQFQAGLARTMRQVEVVKRSDTAKGFAVLRWAARRWRLHWRRACSPAASTTSTRTPSAPARPRQRHGPASPPWWRSTGPAPKPIPASGATSRSASGAPSNAQIAPIVEIGARHGLPCPAISRLIVLIHEVEQGRRALSDDNLLELLP